MAGRTIRLAVELIEAIGAEGFRALGAVEALGVPYLPHRFLVVLSNDLIASRAEPPAYAVVVLLAVVLPLIYRVVVCKGVLASMTNEAVGVVEQIVCGGDVIYGVFVVKLVSFSHNTHNTLHYTLHSTFDVFVASSALLASHF